MPTENKMPLLGLKTQLQTALQTAMQSKEEFPDYPFEPNLNADKLMTRLLHLAETDNKLIQFNDVLDNIELVIQIESKHNRLDNFPNENTAKIIKVYNNHVNKIQESVTNSALNASLSSEEMTSLETMDHYYQRLESSSALNTLKEALPKSLMKSLASLHTDGGLKSAFNQANKSHQHYEAIKEKLADFLKQESLVKLFGEYISNKLPQNPLVKHESQSGSRRASKEIFPNTYPPYTGDPEAQVEIAETIKTIAGKERPSLFKLFSAEQMVKDFKEAFPWAIFPRDAARTELESEDEVDNSTNLLGTETTLSPMLQMHVVQFILLSIDLIGKAVGIKGDRIVENYLFVDVIIHNMDIIAKVLASDTINEGQLEEQANQMMTELLEHENQIKMEQDPMVKPSTNIPITQFCQINEVESCHLLHLNGISPMVPPIITPESKIK